MSLLSIVNILNVPAVDVSTVSVPCVGLGYTPNLIPPLSDPSTPLANGVGFTVIAFVERQPVVVMVYEMVIVPVLMPVTDPEALVTVPTAVLLLVHAPPVVAHVSVVEEPTTTLDAPDIAAGAGFTTIADVLKHPVLTM